MYGRTSSGLNKISRIRIVSHRIARIHREREIERAPLAGTCDSADQLDRITSANRPNPGRESSSSGPRSPFNTLVTGNSARSGATPLKAGIATPARSPQNARALVPHRRLSR